VKLGLNNVKVVKWPLYFQSRHENPSIEDIKRRGIVKVPK